LSAKGLTVKETQRNRLKGGRVVLMEIDVVSKDGNRVSVELRNAN